MVKIPHLLAAAFCLTIVQAAPVPKRLKKPVVHCGEWTQHWNTNEYTTILRDDGTYRATSKNDTYIGKWEWDDKTRRLTVEEWRERSSGSNVLSWYAELDDELSGETVGNITAKVRFVLLGTQ